MLTDELRTYAKGYELYVNYKLLEIADRIDERHERALRESYDSGYASADDWLAQHEDAMIEHGWIRLPLDADGVPIHVGDVMEVKFDTKRRPFTVSFVGERAVAFWVVGQPDLKSFNLDTVLVTHHHEPTVEDVLREFGDWYAHTKGGCDEDGIIAEFAAKLRLVEGDGE